MKKLLFFLCSVTAAQFAAADQRPNILLLMAEDMNQHVSAFGDPVAVTPELDKLAAQGVRYTNTFATSGVCAPSRAAIIMGVHQVSFGGQHMRTDSYPGGSYRSVPPVYMKAFPELLRAVGYYTFSNNKLDYQFSGPLPGSGPFTVWDEDGRNNDWHDAPSDRPFFGYMNFLVTHESGVFEPLGDASNSQLQKQLLQFRAMQFGVPEVNTPVHSSAVIVPPYFPDTPTVRADMARHYNNIAQLDTQIGDILDQLEAEGLLEQTIVIWTADNGDGLPRAKREIYDSGVKVPMIIRWPDKYRPADAVAGTVDSRMISFVDLAPTILALAGAEIPAYMHGQNFIDPRVKPRQYIYAQRDRIDEVPDRQRLVRDKQFAYLSSYRPDQGGGQHIRFRDNISMVRELYSLHEANKLTEDQARWFEPVGEERLYDTVADPHQLNNLAGDTRYGTVLERMRAAYQNWRRQVIDMSDDSEADMVQSFFPRGKQPVTEPPHISLVDGKVTLKNATEGASIGYRLDEGRWLLYRGPVTLGAGEKLEARAVRYGWKESTLAVIAAAQ